MRKILCVLLVLTLVLASSGCGQKSTQRTVALYFVNADKTGLVKEVRDIVIKDNQPVVKYVIEELVKGPTNPENKSIIPQNGKLNSVSVSNDMAILDFSGEVFFSNDADALLFSASVLRTATELEGIGRVLITIDGGDFVNSQGHVIGIMNKTDIVYDTSPEVKQQRELVLYFANADGSYLSKETREIIVNEKESLELQTLKELLNGPENKNHSRTIPLETKIISVETKDGVCFVNLSQEFILKHTGGTASEQLTIYSIVNTLTELDEVDSVQFLIDGQKKETFIHMLINEPFERDEGLIE